MVRKMLGISFKDCYTNENVQPKTNVTTDITSRLQIHKRTYAIHNERKMDKRWNNIIMKYIKNLKINAFTSNLLQNF